jgi:hypothetical protein
MKRLHVHVSACCGEAPAAAVTARCTPAPASACYVPTAAAG